MCEVGFGSGEEGACFTYGLWLVAYEETQSNRVL